MPNYCSYEMKVVGKKKNVDKLLSYLQADYDFERKDDKYIYKKLTADKHFFRVFDAEICDEETFNEYAPEEDISEIIYGSCAWSVITCMFSESTGTYCGDHISRGANFENGFRGTHMVEATKELDLAVEIFSEEPGCEFMEHFIVDKGNVLSKECVEWRELYDENGEPILDEHGDQLTEGGLEWEYTI